MTESVDHRSVDEIGDAGVSVASYNYHIRVEVFDHLGQPVHRIAAAETPLSRYAGLLHHIGQSFQVFTISYGLQVFAFGPKSSGGGAFDDM